MRHDVRAKKRFSDTPYDLFRRPRLPASQKVGGGNLGVSPSPAPVSSMLAQGASLLDPMQSPVAAPPSFGSRLHSALNDWLLANPSPSFTTDRDRPEPFLASLLESGLGTYGAIQRGREYRAAAGQTAARQGVEDSLRQALIQAQTNEANTRALAITNAAHHTKYTPITSATGEVFGYDPEMNTLTSSGGRVAPKPTATSIQERGAAGVADEMETAVNTIDAITQRNPSAIAEVSHALGAGLVPGVGKALEAVRSYGMSPDAQQAYNAYKSFVLNVSPLRGGSRPSQQLIQLEQQATAPAIGESPVAWQQKLTAMRRLIAEARARAGNAASKPAVSQGGAAPVQAAPTPAVTPPPTAPPVPQVPPYFRPPT